ncbi:putative aarF domain-containing protein kinase [Apostasia shenzhenica]|uniref:Putative aarF domain-containing protein kinase n=1 Tax=Apostasia shenzhenica TaxID=1088818 RepID=A0A2H9ZSA1_9ASPA|nr:putative aarF domain-containing protein kinase [Apostasia shenzhenica]
MEVCTARLAESGGFSGFWRPSGEPVRHPRSCRGPPRHGLSRYTPAMAASTESPVATQRGKVALSRRGGEIAGKWSNAMEQLDLERGVCIPFRKYTPEAVRSKVLESRGAILSLIGRGVEIVWKLGLYWLALTYDCLVGRDEEVVPYRACQLRNLLCDLGPSFIKAGQVLANRPDIIREDYMNELCILQDDVPPFPNQIAFDIIEEELGQPLERLFSRISSQTIAAASLGQVYRATLRDTGENVAIKVLRPGIEPIIYRDLFLFRTLASFLNGISLEKLGCNAELIVDEFGEKLLEELDYTLEARNIEDFLENFKDDPTVKIPRVYKHLSGSRALVMEWIDGIRCTDPQAIKEAGIDMNGFLTVGVSAALRQLLEFGLFHGDPHPGNIFALRDGRIAYVDFGNVAVLSQQNKQILIDAVVHAVNEDYAEMANDFTRLGFLASGTDVSPIIPALEAIWQNSVGKGLSDFNFRSVTGKFNQLVYQYPIRIPERFSLVIRSLLTQEGICFTLKPDFKFLEVAYPYVAKRLLTDPNPALRERLIQVDFRSGLNLTCAPKLILLMVLCHELRSPRVVLFKDGMFQWKRLENLIILAKENVSKMNSNPALQVKNMSYRWQVKKKLDLTGTIKDGARMFLIDAGIRRQLILALTEDSKLHIQELFDVYKLVEDDVNVQSVALEILQENPITVNLFMYPATSSLVAVIHLVPKFSHNSWSPVHRQLWLGACCAAFLFFFFFFFFFFLLFLSLAAPLRQVAMASQHHFSPKPTAPPLYPEVLESNFALVTNPNPASSSSSSLYPTIDPSDLAEKLFPDACSDDDPTVEEALLRISGAILHLIDKERSVELACGDLTVLRLIQGRNLLAAMIRVSSTSSGEDVVQWPLARDSAVVKLDESHYFFTLRVPDDGGGGGAGHDLLNYGLTVASKGQEGLLREFDEILQKYGAFSVHKVEGKAAAAAEVLDGSVAKEVSPGEMMQTEAKRKMMEKRSAAYWTTIAPNVEDYSGLVAKAIALGSGQLIRGILWCGDVTVERLRWGNQMMKQKMGPNNLNAEVSPETLKRIKRVKRVTRMSEKVANGILSGVIKVSGYFTSSVVNSRVGKKFFGLLPGEIVLASLDGFGKICDAVEVTGKNVLSTSSTVTTELVSHRYGEQAAEATNHGLDAAGHALGTAWAAFKIRKAIDPKSSLKPTSLAKSAVKAAAEDLRVELKAKKSK